MIKALVLSAGIVAAAHGQYGASSRNAVWFNGGAENSASSHSENILVRNHTFEENV